MIPNKVQDFCDSMRKYWAATLLHGISTKAMGALWPWPAQSLLEMCHDTMLESWFFYDEHKKTVVHKYVHNLTVACQAMLKNPHWSLKVQSLWSSINISWFDFEKCFLGISESEVHVLLSQADWVNRSLLKKMTCTFSKLWIDGFFQLDKSMPLHQQRVTAQCASLEKEKKMAGHFQKVQKDETEIMRNNQEMSWVQDLGGGFKHVCFHLYLGKWSNLTSILFGWVETTNWRHKMIGF